MKLPNNTFEEWQAAYVTLLQNHDHVIEVEINSAEITMESFTNLRYFFPLAFHLLQIKEISFTDPLVLDIQFTGEKKDEDIWRLKTFLSQMWHTPEATIKLEGIVLEDIAWRAGRIFPLCRVQNVKINPKSSPHHNESEISPFPTYQILNNFMRNDSIQVIKAENNANIFFTLSDQLFKYICDENRFIGTARRNFSSKEKKLLLQELNSYLCPQLDHMCILAQIIWLYILRELIEMKVLFSIPEAKEQPHIFENIMQKSRLDAVSYSESMYQLIENACIHSQNGIAWFGFRVHRAGKNEPMSNMANEALTRNRLYNHYQNCFIEADKNNKPRTSDNNIFNKDYRFFFEFFVLDDAATQKGMIQTYNQMVEDHNNEQTAKYYKKMLLPEELKAFEGTGIPTHQDKWEESIKKAQKDNLFREKVQTIAQLINLPVKKRPLEHHIFDLTVHYGLRVLRNIISVNDGYLLGRTPSGKDKTLLYYNGNTAPLKNLQENELNSYVTEWSAIIPISYNWSELTLSNETISGQNCFGDRIEKPREKLYYLTKEDIFQKISMQNKLEDIQNLRNNLHQNLSGQTLTELEISVILLQAYSNKIYDLEIFSKALFAEIAEIFYINRAQKTIPLRLALIFEHPDDVFEFIRFFSAFYPSGIQEDMKNVQIALCIKIDFNEKYIYDVVAILVGTRLSSTYEYARLFAYNHSDKALEYLPLLGYLTGFHNEASDYDEKIALFPFELCLPAKFEETNVKELDWEQSWFIEKMQHILRTNIQDASYGCMIDDIHLRLGSKLHVNRFFEAELLFHNMGYVVRFAYLIANELLYGENKLLVDQQVLLLGYEKYSSILILQIKYWLTQSLEFCKVNSAIVYDSEGENEVKIRPYFDEEQNTNLITDPVQVVTILPVGTTLSTIYKVYNVTEKNLGKYFSTHGIDRSNSRNFCIVTVNSNLDLCSDMSSITAKYWSKIERNAQLITLQRETTNGKEVQVKYFVKAAAEWYDPEHCPICKKNGKDIRPLIDGKHSNTMPGAIFSLWGTHAGTFKRLVKNPEDNYKRLSSLLGNVFYTHIYDGNNHFQFYIDFKKLYEENKAAIDLDLRNQHVKKMGFNVVISPLQLTNAPFIKSVIDNVFDGNVRFLHLNLSDAYREEVRAKFSHLTQEFREMRLANPKAQINFYFADTSIVTGSRLNRARLLINMLLNQSYIDYRDIRLFEKVFLLVNRCSYDTANYFVQKPEDNLYAYIHLAIPSYNTENDFCPACQLTSKFKLLGKRSSTEKLSREFLRLQEKHKKRTVSEYQFWLEGNNNFYELSDEYSPNQAGTLLTSPAYFGWLKQWLYVNISQKTNTILSFVPEEVNTNEKYSNSSILEKDYQTAIFLKETILNYTEEYETASDNLFKNETTTTADQTEKQDSYLEKHVKTNLYDVAKHISDKNMQSEFLVSAKKIIKAHLIAVRDYMRLKSMQLSYEKLESQKFENGIMRRVEYRNVILELIGNAIDNVSNAANSQLSGLSEEEKNRFLLTYNVEWLISYIKVLSRTQIVNYYEYRQAITGIMNDILRVLSRKQLYDEYMQTLPVSNGGKDTASQNFLKIVKLIGTIRGYGECDYREPQLCAQLCYQVNMTLVHRMADLQISSQTDTASVLSIMNFYNELLNQYFSFRPKEPLIDLPPSSQVIIRYLKAAKAATMTSHDDVPCLALTAIPGVLEHMITNVTENSSAASNLLCVAQYIYLENTRMLYSGMLDMKEKISTQVLMEMETCRPADSFADSMNILSQEVVRCLSKCYYNLDQKANEADLLYQNPLSNFCRFWHKSTGEAPISEEDKILPIAYMLRYFMRLDDLSSETGKKWSNDELPYLYEELCRILCGITGFQMCYFTYCHAGNYPEIFSQSGYHTDLMMSGKILTPMRMDEIIHLTKSKDTELVAGIYKITAKQDCDYLVLFIPPVENMSENDGFYIVFQSDILQNIFCEENTKINWRALRKARDVLFMRRRLQEVLSRDYTILINYRFDYSYVRSISKAPDGHPSAMHISDLHIHQDMSKQTTDICNRIKNVLQNYRGGSNPPKIDLLIISGDIVDSKDANASKLEQNYRYAEQLLSSIISTLWKDESGYLPHDWRRRIVVTTGNHDFASMNQYQAMQKGRVLTSAMPADGESGTMSKFAYFIEFLIHYLDAPVDQLLYNDLNEVRFYQKLNLKVLSLNCSGNATSYRTNKMGINYEKVRELLNRDVWKSTNGKLYNEDGKILKHEPFRLIVGHYSPQYDLSYFLDKYDVIPGWVWEPDNSRSRPINDLIKLFQDAAQYELIYRPHANHNLISIRNDFMEEFSALNQVIKLIEEQRTNPLTPREDKFYKCLYTVVSDAIRKDPTTDHKVIINRIVHTIRENNLYKQLEKYNNWLTGTPEEWSEEMSKLFYEVCESIGMGEQDKKTFTDFINKELGNKDLYLAGHIHAYAEDNENHILVADKLFDKSRVEIHGYIIQDMIKGNDPAKNRYHSERFS